MAEIVTRPFIWILLLFSCVATLAASDIVVITIAQGKKYQEYVKIGTDSKREYCKKHGYDFIYCEDSLDTTRHVYWSKILLALQAFKHPFYKWVVWLDADTLIMNQDIPLEDLIDERYNFIIGQDFNGINSGVFIIKNCEWSKKFLKDVYARTDCMEEMWPEQTAIEREIQANDENNYNTKIVSQRVFNSFIIDGIAYLFDTRKISPLAHIFQPGDFLIHFASHRTDELAKLMEKYSKQAVCNRALVTLDQYLGYYGFILLPMGTDKQERFITHHQREQFNERLSHYPHIQYILEIGLNGGHSAENFFQTCKNLKTFVSVDINEHPYTEPAIEYLERQYKNRFYFIEGDSVEEVPSYAAAFPKNKFDLIFIDGKKTKEHIVKDILNCQKVAHPETILWVNGYDDSVKDDVKALQGKGIIRIKDENTSASSQGERRWIEARYLFPSKV